jgi:hypothetical protein
VGWHRNTCGDALTCKVLTKQNQVIYHSVIRHALDPTKCNQCLSPLGGETASNSKSPPATSPDNVEDIEKHMATIYPKDLIGEIFEAEEYGQCF